MREKSLVLDDVIAILDDFYSDMENSAGNYKKQPDLFEKYAEILIELFQES